MNNEFPRGWAKTKVGKVGKVYSGTGFPKKFQGQKTGKYPFFKVGDISKEVQKGKIYIDTADNHIDSDVAAKIKSKVLPAGAIVFAKIGEALKLNRRGILTGESIIDNNALGIKADDRVYNNKLLFYFLKTVDLSLYSAGNAVPSVRKSTFEEIELPLPPLPEQHRIVTQLDALLGRVAQVHERLERLPDLLQQFRQSVLARAVSGELTADWREGNSDLEKVNILKKDKKAIEDSADKYVLFELPEKWAWVKIKDIGDVKGGKRLPKGESLVTTDTGFPYIKAGNLKSGTVIEEGIEFLLPDIQKKISRYIVEAGDVYITIVGACIGDSGVIPEKYDGANLTENACKICNRSGVLSHYLSIWLRSPFCQGFIKETIMSGAQGKLALGRVKMIPIPLPSEKEQQEIVRRVESLLALADRIEVRYEELWAKVELLPQAILAKAFRGELVPQEAGDEPAGVLLERISKER